MNDADFEWIGQEYREGATTQTYGPRPSIDGVRMIDLTVFADEGGDFCEVARISEAGGLVGFDEFRPAQISYSAMEPGTIKAWHLHRRQNDLWFVPPNERVLIGLLDVRDSSPSYSMTMRFALGAGKARLLYIPHGVAHGVANLSTSQAHILYFVSHVFDAEAPDEHRLPFDLLGAEFWSIRPG